MKGLIAIAVLGAGAMLLMAQNRMNYSLVSQESGHVALGLAVRKLTVSGTFLQAPAHPDDETNALFALFGHGMGLRAIDLQNNRGDGGQNEIGPELFADMAVLRTRELLAAHRLDGAEQYFTRAIDYGYSFDPGEGIGKWGRRRAGGYEARRGRTYAGIGAEAGASHKWQGMGLSVGPPAGGGGGRGGGGQAAGRGGAAGGAAPAAGGAQTPAPGFGGRGGY